MAIAQQRSKSHESAGPAVQPSASSDPIPAGPPARASRRSVTIAGPVSIAVSAESSLPADDSHEGGFRPSRSEGPHDLSRRLGPAFMAIKAVRTRYTGAVSHTGSKSTRVTRPGLDLVQLLSTKPCNRPEPPTRGQKLRSVLFRLGLQWVAPIRAVSQDVRVKVFILVILPLALFTIALVFALPLSLIQKWSFRGAMGFVLSGATGGAIHLQGFDLSPSGVGYFIAGFVCASCVASFALLIAMLNTLQGSADKMAEDRVAQLTQKSPGRVVLVIFSFSFASIFWQVVLALVVGGMICFLEKCTYRAAVETVIYIQVGGGLPARNVLVSNTTPSVVLIVIVAGWQLGLKALMISHMSTLIGASMGPLLQGGVEASIPRLVGLWSAFHFVVVPILGVAYMAASAVVPFLHDCSDFEAIFWESFAWMSGAQATLFTEHVSCHRWVEITASFAYIGSILWEIAIGIGMGIVQAILVSLRAKLKPERSLTHSFLQLCVTSFVYVPVLVTLLSSILGGMLSVAEDWPAVQGLLWCFSAQLGGGITLSSSSPSSRVGRAIGLMAAFQCFAVSTISIGCVQRPAIHAIIAWFWDSIDSIMLFSCSCFCFRSAHGSDVVNEQSQLQEV